MVSVLALRGLDKPDRIWMGLFESKQDYRRDLREYFRKYFMELKVFRWTQEEVIWVRNGQGWFQLKFKGSRVHDTSMFKVDFTPHKSKIKSHFKFI